jgi:hypothetical protein
LLAQEKPRSINTYAIEVDRFGKRHAARLFANVISEADENDHWREFKNEAELEHSELTTYEQVSVWRRQGNLVAANFTLSSPSGDWVHYANYYFRKDGSLAKVHSELNTFHGNVSAIRDEYFDGSGKSVHRTLRVLDLKTRRPKRLQSYYSEELTIYRRVQDLPFFKLL